MLIIWLLASLFACQKANEPVDSGSQTDLQCVECLEQGMTWQPEASACTESCEIQDISCFTAECPGVCGESCGDCFSEADCNDAGCSWQFENEAAWCSEG